MHLLDHEGHAGPGGKADKKKQDLIVAGTLALVVIAYLTLKHMGSSAGATTTGTTSGVPGSAADASGGTSPDTAALQNALNGISGQIADLGNRFTGGTPSNATPDTGGGSPAPIGGTTPATKAPLPAGYGYLDTAGSTYTVASIAKRYGLTIDQLKAMNPSAGITGTSSQVIQQNRVLKVRTNAAPFDLAAYTKINPTQFAHPTGPSTTATAPPKPTHPLTKH